MSDIVLRRLEDQAALVSSLQVLLQTPTATDQPQMKLFGLIDASQPPKLASLLEELKPFISEQSEPCNLYDDLKGQEIAALGPRLVSLQSTHKAITAACRAAFNTLNFSLIVSADETKLTAHLRHLREFEIPDGSPALFRYQDTRVASALMPLLKPAQATNMLGDAIAWFAPQVCGQAIGWQYTQLPDKIKIAVLRLTEKQFAALDDALFANTVEQQVRETDSSLLEGMNACATATLLNERIALGKSKELRTKKDLSLFAVLSLQLPKGFESKAPFAQAIERTVKERITFAKSLEQVPSKEWEAFERR
jgi:hypothetical protein